MGLNAAVQERLCRLHLQHPARTMFNLGWRTGLTFVGSSRSAPVPEPICASLRSVAPGQGEPLLDQNLPEILSADIDAGESAPVAVLAMPLDL